MGILLGPRWVDKHSSQTVLLLLSSKDPPPPSSLYRNEWEGSVVMFGGVDHHYYEGEFNWIPLIEAGDWSVHMDRQASLSEEQPK